MKILVGGADDRVLGVHVVGPDAVGRIVQLVAVAMRMESPQGRFPTAPWRSIQRRRRSW